MNYIKTYVFNVYVNKKEIIHNVPYKITHHLEIHCGQQV